MSGCDVLINHEGEKTDNRGTHFPTVDDHIDHAVFEQKLTSLKALWQFLADRLLDHTGPGKTDQSLWLSKNNVSKHGKTGRDAAGGWIGENRDKREACLM